MENTTMKSLSRFKISDEHLINDKLIQAEIAKAFDEHRCYEFYPDNDAINGIAKGDPVEIYRETFIEIQNKMYDIISKGDQTTKGRLFSDTRLSSRIISSIIFTHRAIAEANIQGISTRRIVIIKESPGVPTIYHISDESTVIAHVGLGPAWAEIPTIYLGLKTFDTLIVEQKRKEDRIFQAFKLLLMVEERAIETGYAHSGEYPFEVSRSLAFLVDEVVKSTSHDKVEETLPEEETIKKITKTTINNLYKELDARAPHDELNFDYDRNIKAVKYLERLARKYRKSNHDESLKAIVKIIIAASGHDIHEVRNRANIILERVLSPKEYDAPLATRFINVSTGSTYNFKFKLKSGSSYLLRIYRNSKKYTFFSENDLDFQEIKLNPSNDDNSSFECEHTFDKYGHYDFCIIRKKQKNFDWIDEKGTSGRVNVIPDMRGNIILEIFTDIHGHTKTYWRDEGNNPGLLYNENGEVIRLGNLIDIKEHLEDIKSRYCISSIYLLGVQKRGKNREDWAAEASSPSPFSPLNLTEIEPSLGGEEALIALVKKAHSLNIKIIVDIIPHINRRSDALNDNLVVKTYGIDGNLVNRSSTDGRYGTWDDGKLLNYRKLEIWEWLANSIMELIDKFDIDGIRFDSAHAVPIMMKKNNYLYIYDKKRNHEEMVNGEIIVNDREDEHFITTGYYDSACRDQIAVPIHYYLMQNIEKKLREKNKDYFVNIAECFWGHERFLTRTGLIPYNASLFKICENITHGKTDTREIYHIYDNYFPTVLAEGTELLGILGNHDERRALNTFGHRGLRAAVALTSFMSNVIMDYEGSAEGEGWKVFLDNVYVNWNQFEYASHRSLEGFYKDWYKFHRKIKGKGYLVWANNNKLAASMKFTDKDIWLGIFNFADSNESATIQFDNPSLPIDDNKFYILSDILYSKTTEKYSYFKGSELKISRINTVVTYTDRVKLFQFKEVNLFDHYKNFITDSFNRLCEMDNVDDVDSNFIYSEILNHSDTYSNITQFFKKTLIPIFWDINREKLYLGLKRAIFYLFKNEVLSGETLIKYGKKMSSSDDQEVRELGTKLLAHNQPGALVFMSAEADPFSKSGGLANVVYELPRELANLNEEVYVITGYYKHGSDKAISKMMDNVKKYDIRYTGTNIKFMIMGNEYEVGIHYGLVDGIHYYLLEHHEFFDGLYWGITAEEKLKRRIAFSRSCAEVIISFNLKPHYTFTNDAYAGLFNGIVRSDPYYENNINFKDTTFLHIIHNGGWQYFDAYNRNEKGFDLFNLFNLPSWRGNDFTDPVFHDRLSCMATGIKFSDRTITVSPSYAKQIEYASDGLEHLLSNVIGISNAIGNDFKEKVVERFLKTKLIENNYDNLVEHIKGNIELNKKIKTRYPEILKGINAIDKIEDEKKRYILYRMRNKLLLQLERNLIVDPDKILFTMIHRISEQKGFQLLLDASEGIFKNNNYQAIIGGATSSGDKRGDEIAHGLFQLSQFYPGNVNVSFGFQDVATPLLCSDLFGMPSMHEPGGISQLEAFSTGCLVVARATGGLKDTVFPITTSGGEIKGNGFLFSDYNAWAFYDAMDRAAQFFNNSDDETIYNARINAEKSVHFWDHPAKKYIKEIYSMTETIRIIG